MRTIVWRHVDLRGPDTVRFHGGKDVDQTGAREDGMCDDSVSPKGNLNTYPFLSDAHRRILSQN